MDALRAAGVIAISPDGAVLMCRRTDSGEWAFPAGTMEEGETPEKTAVREFFEETGYRLGRVQPLMRRIKDGVDFSTFVTVVDAPFRPRLNHEHDAYEWFDPRQVADIGRAEGRQRFRPPAQFSDAYADLYDPDEPRDPAGRWTSLGGSKGNYALISSRPITALGQKPEEKEAFNAARKQYNRVEMEALKASTGIYDRNIHLFKDGRFYPGILPDEVKGTTDEIAKAVEHRMAENLVFLAKNAMKEYPEDWHKWIGWYEGAHKLAEKYAKTYGIDVASASGVIAALSPQNDWSINVRMAGVVIDALANKRDTKWDDSMTATAKRIWKKTNIPFSEELIKTKPTLGELLGSDKAGRWLASMWIRTYDESHSDMTYRNVNPDGSPGDFARNADGAKTKAKWTSNSATINAIESFMSHGNADMLSHAMGEKHKVRSFYNNILDPDSPNGDVTIDTHAVGAAWLLPSTQKDIPVVHALHSTLDKDEQPKGYKATGRDSTTGISGTYAVYADAYRDAAKTLGLQPRQLQSLVWEAKQRLFSDKVTGTRVKTAVDAVWRKFHDGGLTLHQAQNEVVKVAEKTLNG
jgi:8-oxo-dGTP pyrophosphatase MutT (NUDIX family)